MLLGLGLNIPDIAVKQRHGTTTPAVVNNPPFGIPSISILSIIATAGQPPSPNPFIGGRQPMQPGALPPSLLSNPPSNPPFVNPGRLASTGAIINQWQPPPPSPFIGGWQPLQPGRLPPGIPG